MNQKNLENLINDTLAIEAEAAKEAGAIGYMARALVQATMPHKNPGDVEAWGRENGAFSMVMQPGIIKVGNEFKRIGLPYGTYPRLLLAWLNTEAVRKKERTLVLGKSLAEFMRHLEIKAATGGRWGTIGRLKEQMHRLFSSRITCNYSGVRDKLHRVSSKNINIANSYDIWWDTQNPSQAGLWQSTVTLGEEFFKEITDHAVPVDMRALKALKGSSMRLDIYTWLTYRMSYLKKSARIPWQVLQMQFGSDFGRTIDFKIKFKEHLKAVLLVYSEAKVETSSDSFILHPSKPHVPIIACA